MAGAVTGERSARWMGHPFQIDDYRLQPGLPSGIPPNPDFGKYFMTATYLCLFDDYFGDVLETGVDVILRGDHPLYGLLNMGDDSVVLSNDSKFVRELMQKLEDEAQVSPYFQLEKEDAVAFLGNVFYRDDREDLKLSPNIASFINNWFAPEISTTHVKREFWPVGWMERQQFYMQSPSFQDAWEIMVKHFYDTWHVHPDLYASKAKDRMRVPAFPVTSEVDRIVLEDPSKLYYRFDADELSSEILDSIVGTIPADDVMANSQPFVVGG
jgi:hypothetical protein